jgi:hypothetical protein
LIVSLYCPARRLRCSDRTTLDGAGWVDLGNPSNDATTFDSQSTFLLPYTHPDGHKTLIYGGDRWNADGPGGLKNSSYIWWVGGACAAART